MGYTEYSEVEGDLTAEEMEDIRADVERICDVAQAVGIPLDRSVPDYVDDSPQNIISLNGVGDQACDPLVISRYLPTDIHDPGKSYFKTYRRDYTPVVQASLMALKQLMPARVQIGSDGDWGYEWLHGVDCNRDRRDKNTPNECDKVDEAHIGMSGRRLHALAFPDTPFTENVFRSPLEAQELGDAKFYIPQDVKCRKKGSGYEGLPFGVTLRTLLEQAEKNMEKACFVCGCSVSTRVQTLKGLSSPTKLSAPMCSFCLHERLEGGELLGYTFAKFPYALVSIDAK